MSKFLHNPEKGCDMEIDVILYRPSKKGKMSHSRGSRCFTHECDVCHCGWEYGFHYGGDSGALDSDFKKKRRLIMEARDEAKEKRRQSLLT